MRSVSRNTVPDQDTILRYDLSAGRALPALYDITLTLRDRQAFQIESTRNQFSDEKFQEKLRESVLRWFHFFSSSSHPSYPQVM